MDARTRHTWAKELFLEALDEPADARRAFVQLRAGRDVELQNDVLSLLAHHLDVPLMALDRGAPRDVRPPPRAPRAPSRLGAIDARSPAPPEVIVAAPRPRVRAPKRRGKGAARARWAWIATVAVAIALVAFMLLRHA